MNNTHQELIVEKMSQLGDLWRLIETKETTDSGCPRFERVNREVAQTLQDTIDTLLEGERIQLHKLIEKEAEATYAEMLKEVLRQNGLPEGGHALMNTDMMHHIVTGCVGNLSTRLNQALDKTPPNKV